MIWCDENVTAFQYPSLAGAAESEINMDGKLSDFWQCGVDLFERLT